MKITAILCNYNGEAYLGEAIRSVLGQRRPVDELILVDDGSTDGSKGVMAGFSGEAGVRILEHERNSGQAAGFNTAIGASTGDLLCFIDSDDLWFPEKVGEMEALAEREPRAVLLQHNLAVIRGETRTDELFMKALTWGDHFAFWRSHIFFPYFAPTAGVVLRADAARKVVPVPTHLRHSADSFLTRAAIAHGPVAIDPRALGGYRRHEDNAVHGNEGHSAWRFFLDEVGPHLHRYYLAQGLPSPLPARMRCGRSGRALQKLLDASPRSIALSLARRWRSVA